MLADPNQLDNRAGYASHRAAAEVLRGRLIRRMIAAGEAEPIIEPAPMPARAGSGVEQLRVAAEEGWQ